MERMALLFIFLTSVIETQGIDVTSGRGSPPLPGVINQKFDSSIKPVRSQHLLSAFQHMITMAFNDLEHRIEDKLEHVQNNLNGKISSLDVKAKNRMQILQNDLNDRFNSLTHAFNDLENRVEDKLAQMQSDLNEKVIAIQIKTENILKQNDNIDVMVKTQGLRIANIEGKTNTGSVNLENIKQKVNDQQGKLFVLSKSSEKLEEGINKIVDKVLQIDSRLSVIDCKTMQNKAMKTIQYQIDEHFSKVMNASQVTGDALNKTSSLLTSLNKLSMNFENSIDESYQQIFSNLTREMENIFEKNKNISGALQANFLSLKNDVEISWHKLESSTEKSIAKNLKALQETASGMNLTLTNTIESALKDFFVPTTCQKNQCIPNSLLSHNGLFKSHFLGLDVPVLCDAVTSGGGWIIIQRRYTGEVDFYRDWASYKEGFGSLDTEFWLGNENIHEITTSGDFELRVDLKYKGKSYYAAYSKFSVAGEDSDYTLTVEGYSGTAGNMLSYHNSKRFSTYNRDKDNAASENCAKDRSGAWWYDNCGDSNLNGKWGGDRYETLEWRTLTTGYSVSFSEMKIRQK